MKRVLLVLVVTLLAAALPASAHPLGNFTTNVHLGLLVTSTEIEIDLVVDMAEIPAFQEKPSIDDGYAQRACADHADAINLRLDGQPLLLTPIASGVSFPPGQGELNTLRLECGYEADTAEKRGTLTIENNVYADRLGWAEIVIASTEVELDTELPAISPSNQLRDYPTETVDVRTGDAELGGLTTSTTRTPDQSASSNPTLIERTGALVAGGGLLAILGAVALGGLHALAPGHGKTLMAAYLIGRQSRPRTAVALGLSVAVAHTLGVGVLGLITALASSAFRPERIYPWLSLASAVIVLAIGLGLLWRLRSNDHHEHSHDHHHDHDHESAHGHDPHHGHDDQHRLPEPSAGWRSWAGIGLAGGLVPSASAVVLLLGAVAQGRPWWGLLLVGCFGIGMSIALVGAGMLAVMASRWGFGQLRSDRLRLVWQRRVPIIAGIGVTLIGAILVWDSGSRFLA